MAQCNAALEPTKSGILEWTSDENIRHMHQGEELRQLVERLPDELLATIGLHRQMISWMTQYQQICLLDHAWRSDELIVLLGYPLSGDLHTFLLEAGDRTDYWYGFRVGRDFSWDRNFDRPRDPLVFDPQSVQVGQSHYMRTVIMRHSISATLLDHYEGRQSGTDPILRLEHRKEYNGENIAYDSEVVNVRAEEYITPFEEFCCPPDAKVTIGYRKDGRIDVMVFAKEMPGSPVLYWIFPDPKNHGLDPAYQDFLWWL